MPNQLIRISDEIRIQYRLGASIPPVAKGDTPLEPQPLTYRGAIWPGASRVTEDCSPLVPGCTIPIEALMAINIYCSPIGTPIGTPETSSYRGLLSQLLAKVIEAIASL